MLLLLLTSLAWADSVKIEAEGPGAVRVRSTGAAVYMPACGGVSWERFDSETAKFVPVSTPPCGALAPAILVDAEGVQATFKGVLPPDPDGGVHVVRAVAVSAQKCTENKPFPLAGCVGITRVLGPNQVVRGR